MDSEWKAQYAIEQMRMQRHDFMNYLQVVFGYIQINKPSEAAKYIIYVNRNMSVLSRIFNLECDIYSLFMQEFILECSKLGIETEFETEIEYISCSKFSKDIEEKKNIFDRVFSELLDNMKKLSMENIKIYIFLKGTPESFGMIVGNFKECADRMNFQRENKLHDNIEFDKETGISYEIVSCEGYVSAAMYFS